MRPRQLRRYKGRHRANRFSLRVADLQQQCGRDAVLGKYWLTEYLSGYGQRWFRA